MKISTAQIEKIADMFGFTKESEELYCLELAHYRIFLYLCNGIGEEAWWSMEIRTEDGHRQMLDVIDDPIEILIRFSDFRVDEACAQQKEKIKKNLIDCLENL